MPKKVLKTMTMEERVARLENVVEKLRELNNMVEEMDCPSIEIKPLADYLDVILYGTSAVRSLKSIAEDYGLELHKLLSILEMENLVCYDCENDGFLLLERARKAGFIAGDGISWTRKGLYRIHKILTQLGYKADIDKQA